MENVYDILSKRMQNHVSCMESLIKTFMQIHFHGFIYHLTVLYLTGTLLDAGIEWFWEIRKQDPSPPSPTNVLLIRISAWEYQKNQRTYKRKLLHFLLHIPPKCLIFPKQVFKFIFKIFKNLLPLSVLILTTGELAATPSCFESSKLCCSSNKRSHFPRVHPSASWAEHHPPSTPQSRAQRTLERVLRSSSPCLCLLFYALYSIF